MNVTITIDDELCRQARHHAVDEGKSLSSWLAGLVRKEVGKASPPVATTLLDLLRDDAAGDVLLEIPALKDLPQPANLDA
jgi:hypothetical protein